LARPKQSSANGTRETRFRKFIAWKVPRFFRTCSPAMDLSASFPAIYLINGEGSAAFTPLHHSLAEYRPEINRLAYVEAG